LDLPYQYARGEMNGTDMECYRLDEEYSR